MAGYGFTHGTKFMINDTEYMVNREEDTGIIVENLSYKKTETWDRWELLKLWEKEKLVFKVIKGNEFEIEMPDYGLIPKKLREEAEKKLEILKPVLEGGVLPGEIKQYINALPEKQRISLATFYNWKKRYEASNDIRSLIARHHLKGPRERWSNEIAKGKAIEIINDFIYEGEEYTLDYLYSEYLLRMDELNEFREDEGEKIKPVSETTFWRIKQDNLDLEKRDKNKYGKVIAKLNRNGAQSKVVVHRPLQRIEIDWTPLDVLIIDPKTLKPKRPWLVYAIDKYSDHPLGFFITFEDINANAVKQCLLHCIMPKTYIKELYPLVENEWLAYGKPETLVFDNSRVNESLDVLDACQQLGIETIFCPVDSGYIKGSIERAFKTLNTKVIHGLKGTTFSNTFEKGRYDSEGNAYLSMQSLIYICHIAMVDMIANDKNIRKRATRRDLWIKGLQENPEINLTVPRTKTELKMILMSGIAYRTITNKGISLKNEYYTSPQLMKLRYEYNKFGVKKKVRVRFDLSDIRTIYIYNEFERKYIEAYNKELEEKGFHIDLPIPYSELEWDSKLYSISKKGRDRRLIGRSNRKIRLIQDKDRKRIKKYRKMNKDVMEEMIEVNEDIPSYHGISTEGISHIQLDTPEAADTIQIMKEEQIDINNNKQRKKTNSNKKRSTKKAKTEEKGPIYLSSSFDIDIDDLPDWDTKYRGVKK